MNESSVVCHVPGCQNANIPITIITDEPVPVNVVCGPCGTEIVDITFVQTLPLIEP